MRTKSKIKNEWLGIGFSFLFLVFNWGQKQDLMTTDFFVGKYHGVVVFEENDLVVQSDKSVIHIVKIGDKTNFVFAANIPTISTILYKNNKTKDLINLNPQETNYIKINASKLEILFADGNKSWTVYADRD